MKRAYVRPTMVGERFVANEYVAACWKINCNVPWGYGYMDKNIWIRMEMVILIVATNC